MIIRFSYAGSRSDPTIDFSQEPTSGLPTGSIFLVDTHTGLPVPLVRTIIPIDDLAVFQIVDVSERMVPVPEPSSAMLLAFGVAPIAARRAARR